MWYPDGERHKRYPRHVVEIAVTDFTLAYAGFDGIYGDLRSMIDTMMTGSHSAVCGGVILRRYRANMHPGRCL
jgi:hypothetical protein